MVVGLVAVGVLGLAGAGVLLAGLYGLQVGMRVALAVGMVAIGVTVLLLAFHMGRSWWRAEARHAADTGDTAPGDSVRSPLAAPPGARHRER
jgi:hypothetical protein